MAIFSAIGVGGKVSPDGTITVRAQIVNNASGKTVSSLSVSGASLDACKATLQAELDAREAAEIDTTINLNVSGIVLATSRAPKDVVVASPADLGGEVLS